MERRVRARFREPCPVPRSPRQQLSACGILFQPPAVPVKETALQLLLQFGEGLAGGGLGKPDAVGCPRDGAPLTDGYENLQLPKRDGHILF